MHGESPQQVLERFYSARRSGGNPSRIRVHYGDTETGRDWGDVFNVSGYVGKSTGREPILLMVDNARSMGGPAILTDCIVRIRYANRREGGDIYRHPNYSPPPREDHPADWDKHFA
jgi:hypothetical protein